MSDKVAVSLKLQSDYQMLLEFDEPEETTLLVDEAPPLGAGAGPSPSRLLASSILSCLSASLLFCLRKSRIPIDGLQARAEAELERNEKGRLRITRVNVILEPSLAAEDAAHLHRCLGRFEDFCTVTASVREGIDVSVTVEPLVPLEI
jgi:uncharacterized OsmC-like protein